ncbi:MAG: hypothetical protein CMO01_28320 [Thalassobius sp.]|nr:hypothetical protein [Thalassovita sp.]|tara:strand:- start:484 stop:876 length:393 start_codon:yes stop_codon:yes gene_type:complete
MILSKNEFLIIDDHEIDSDIIEIKIQQHLTNIQFTKANSGKAGLDLIKNRVKKLEQLPGVILLDLYMPGFNGYQFLDEFEEIYPDYIPKPKIILLTSSINPADKKKAKNYKIDCFMIKPLCIDTLKKIIF